MGSTSVLVPVDAIDPENNHRTDLDSIDARAGLERLAQSIEELDLIEPIVIRPRPDMPGRYWLIAGERRWRAHKILGRMTILSVITSDDDRLARAKMMAENAARADLNAIDEARSYHDQIELYGDSIEDVCRIAGKTRSHVEWRLKLLALEPEIQALVASGQLKENFAEAMHGLDGDRQRAMLLLVGKVNVEELWTQGDRFRAAQAEQPLFDLGSFALRQDEVVTELQDGTARAGRLLLRQIVPLMDEVLRAYRVLVDDHDLDDAGRAALATVDAVIDYRMANMRHERVGMKVQ